MSQFCVTFSIDWCHNSATKFHQLLIQPTAHFWHNLHLVLRLCLCLVVWCVFSCVYLDTFCIYTVNTTQHSTLATWPPLVSRLLTSCHRTQANFQKCSQLYEIILYARSQIYIYGQTFTIKIKSTEHANLLSRFTN